MITNDFKINECDKCVYVKETKNSYVILCLYVDNMLIVGSDDDMIKSIKNMLKFKFDMKDMGLVDVILGIKISKAFNGLILSQTHCIQVAQARVATFFISFPFKFCYNFHK